MTSKDSKLPGAVGPPRTGQGKRGIIVYFIHTNLEFWRHLQGESFSKLLLTSPPPLPLSSPFESA